MIPYPPVPTRAEARTGTNGEGGFPHSEIVGSKPAHGSPTLIAACHVLHRLCMPRHPPNALTSRLRVRTTNVGAVACPKTHATHARRAVDFSAISDDRRGETHPPTPERAASERHAPCDRPSRHRLLPFTMSKTVCASPKACEPLRSSSGTCFHIHHWRAGGAYRDRTDDPLLAKQVLSQLS